MASPARPLAGYPRISGMSSIRSRLAAMPIPFPFPCSSRTTEAWQRDAVLAQVAGKAGLLGSARLAQLHGNFDSMAGSGTSFWLRLSHSCRSSVPYGCGFEAPSDASDGLGVGCRSAAFARSIPTERACSSDGRLVAWSRSSAFFDFSPAPVWL